VFAEGLYYKMNKFSEKEDNNMDKKIWKKPQLIVIARSNPEEFALAACKLGYGAPTGPPVYNCANCRKVGAEVCMQCSAATS
jgi:hypothetical protein